MNKSPTDGSGQISLLSARPLYADGFHRSISSSQDRLRGAVAHGLAAEELAAGSHGELCEGEIPVRTAPDLFSWQTSCAVPRNTHITGDPNQFSTPAPITNCNQRDLLQAREVVFLIGFAFSRLDLLDCSSRRQNGIEILRVHFVKRR